MHWEAKQLPDFNKVDFLQKALGVPVAIATILVQRGIEDFESAKAFFRPQLADLHDPFLMKGMQRAVERIDEAYKTQEAIMVFGDYDVDGTTSVTLMYSFLKPYFEKVIKYVPDRYTEGYGISYQGIDVAVEKNIKLIIALDCGIKATEEVAYAKSKGVDFILCDHHLPGNKIPDAIAVLDPKQPDCNYPYKELCGCGVGFKLIQALNVFWNKEFEELIPYLDLVAIAIAADIVPITGENRILAFHGIELLRKHPRKGLQPFIAQLKRAITVSDLVFIIAPRINAAGRMDSALKAVDLLIEEDLEEVKNKAEYIELFNTNRRAKDKQITEEALLIIEQLNEQNRFSTVVSGEEWHKGVIGIVASRLIEHYYRPTVVFSVSGDTMVGSVRSVRGFNVYNVLEACSAYIVQFGGHKYAAGLTIEKAKYKLFKNAFEQAVKAQILPEQRIPSTLFDVSIELSELTPKFFRILEQLAPFGPQNMRPVFRTNNVKDSGYSKTVGKDNTHLKLSIQTNNAPMSGIAFGHSDFLPHIKSKKPFDIFYSLEENEWNGKKEIQLKVKDLVPHEVK